MVIPTAADFGQLLTLALSPPLHPPGSLASGSATEDAKLARWRSRVLSRTAELRSSLPGGPNEAEAIALRAIAEIVTPRP